MTICKPAAVAAIFILLAACGGGGGSVGGGGVGGGGVGGGGGIGSGSGVGSGQTGSAVPTATATQSANPDETLAAGVQAAINQPIFGSVTQSSNEGNINDVTGDAASTSFDGRHVRVTIRRTDGSSVAFNSASHRLATESHSPILSGYSFRSDVMLTSTDTSVTLAAVSTNWNNTDSNDYLAGGYWMHAEGRVNPLEVTGVEIGAFVDGPEISGVPTLPTSGNATYAGRAGGFYGYESGPTGEIQIGDFNGDATLTANFSDSTTISGCIGCNGGISVTGVAVDRSGQISTFSDVNVPGRIRMQSALVTQGQFKGSVKMEADNASVTSSDGSWGGRFSTKMQAGDPRLVAGTVGGKWTEADGSSGVAVGAWFGTRN